MSHLEGFTFPIRRGISNVSTETLKRGPARTEIPTPRPTNEESINGICIQYFQYHGKHQKGSNLQYTVELLQAVQNLHFML
jgi:hypothetical protein